MKTGMKCAFSKAKGRKALFKCNRDATVIRDGVPFCSKHDPTPHFNDAVRVHPRFVALERQNRAYAFRVTKMRRWIKEVIEELSKTEPNKEKAIASLERMLVAKMFEIPKEE